MTANETTPSHEIENLLARARTAPTGQKASYEEREYLLENLEASRQEMETLLKSIPLQKEIYPGWTKKEIISHLTGWEDGNQESLRAMLAGNPPQVPAALRGPDYYNEQSVFERAELSYEQVVSEWRLARQQFCDLVRAMTPEQFFSELIFPWGMKGIVTDAIVGLISHEQEHIHQIRETLE